MLILFNRWRLKVKLFHFWIWIFQIETKTKAGTVLSGKENAKIRYVHTFKMWKTRSLKEVKHIETFGIGTDYRMVNYRALKQHKIKLLWCQEASDWKLSKLSAPGLSNSNSVILVSSSDGDLLWSTLQSSPKGIIKNISLLTIGN